MALPLLFDDLPEDMINEILSRLPNEELFRIESVSKSVQRSVRRVLNRVEAIAFQHSYRPPYLTVTCDHILPVDDLKTLSIFWDETPLTSAVALLKRCPEVKCLDLRIIDNIYFMTMIVSACPQLECLYLAKVKSSYSKWMSFVDFVGKRLRHLSWTNWSIKRLKTLIKACRRLERCHLDCHKDSVGMLMSLKCLKQDQTVLSLETDGQVFDVFNNIKGLTVNFSRFSAIAKQDSNKLDQLRQLTVCFDYEKDNEEDEISPTQFSSLETLILISLRDEHLLQLTECQFPKLRTLHLKKFYVDEDAFQALFNKLNNLKRLIFDNLNTDYAILCVPGQSLAALTQLEVVDFVLELFEDYQLTSVIAMVETMAEMKTIRKVWMRFEFIAFEGYISMKQKKKFVSAVGRLKLKADKIKIEFTYGDWDKEKAQKKMDDWNEAFRKQLEVKRIQQRHEAIYNSESNEVEKLLIWL